MKIRVTQSAVIDADTYGEAENIFRVYWYNGGKVGQPEKVTDPLMTFTSASDEVIAFKRAEFERWLKSGIEGPRKNYFIDPIDRPAEIHIP